MSEREDDPILPEGFGRFPPDPIMVENAELRALTEEAAELLHIALGAANKLNASMTRREVEPRAEFELLGDARDRIYAWRRAYRALNEPTPPA